MIIFLNHTFTCLKVNINFQDLSDLEAHLTLCLLCFYCCNYQRRFYNSISIVFEHEGKRKVLLNICTPGLFCEKETEKQDI